MPASWSLSIWQVEAVVDEKVVRGKLHYLIHWKGYSADEDTWEPENTLSCPELLKKYLDSKKKSGGKKSSPTKKPSPAKRAKTSRNDDDEDEKEYEVERIIEVHHRRNGQREFLVRWKGFKPKDDTWEPEEHLNCQDLIDKFMGRVEKALSVDSKELRVSRTPTDRFSLSTQGSARRLSKRHVGKQR